MHAMPMGEMFAKVRALIEQKVAASIARLVHFTYYTNNSADGMGDTVACDQSDKNSGSYAVRRMQHFGLRSRPPSGVPAIRLGNYTAAGATVVVAEDSSRYGPSDLEEGEVSIYNNQDGPEIRLDKDANITIKAGNTQILINKDGDIEITADTGQDVVVNGGTLQVARKTDKTIGDTTMLAWIAAVSTTLNTAGPVVGAPGTVVPPTDFGIINGGASNFKG